MDKVYLVRILTNDAYGLKKGQLRIARLCNDELCFIRYGKGRLDWTTYSVHIVSLVRELPNTNFFAAR
jgi:hypothetical protein